MTPRVPRLSSLWVRRTSASSPSATAAVGGGGRPSPPESVTGRTSVQTSRVWHRGLSNERVGSLLAVAVQLPARIGRNHSPWEALSRDTAWEVISSRTTGWERGAWALRCHQYGSGMGVEVLGGGGTAGAKLKAPIGGGQREEGGGGEGFSGNGQVPWEDEVYGVPGSERGGEGDKIRGCGGFRATHSLVGKLLK